MPSLGSQRLHGEGVLADRLCLSLDGSPLRTNSLLILVRENSLGETFNHRSLPDLPVANHQNLQLTVKTLLHSIKETSALTESHTAQRISHVRVENFASGSSYMAPGPFPIRPYFSVESGHRVLIIYHVCS